MPRSQPSRTLELPLSMPDTVDAKPEHAYASRARSEAVRAASAPGDLDTPPVEPGPFCCPVCGQAPSPLRMPRRIPQWLARALSRARTRALAPRFAYGPGWAR